MKAIYNSRALPLEKISLEISNRAFCYGDGLFETIVTGPERINLTHYHMARLVKACALLHIEISFDAQLLENMMDELRVANEIEGDARFRLQVWRQSGGLYEPHFHEASFLLTCDTADYPFYAHLDRMGISHNAKVAYHQLSFSKSMSALPYVVAGLEKKHTEYDELIITNEAGMMAESIASNLFWIEHDQIYTPALETGCIEGTMRTYLKDQLGHENKGLIEIQAKPEALQKANAIFLTNAAGIRWIKQYKEQKLENPLIALQPLFKQPLQP